MTREIIVDVLRGYDEVRSIGQIADEIVRRLAETRSVAGTSATERGTPAPADHVVGDADEQAAVNLGAAVLARVEDPSVREIAIRNALTEATKVLAVIQKGALPVRASEQAKINTYKSMPQTNTHDVSLLGWTDINWDINSSVDVPCAWDAIAMSARRYRVRWVGGSYTLFINGNREGCYPTAAAAKAAAQADHEQHRTPSPAPNTVTAGQGVEVKPLEWGHHNSRAPNGNLYTIVQLSQNVWGTYWNGAMLPGWSSNADRAKFVAQLHFDHSGQTVDRTIFHHSV